MIKNLSIDNIVVVYNEEYEFEKDFLDNDMLIYKLSFPDKSFYIGKTNRRLLERINEHVYGTLKVDKKINEFNWVKVSILDFAKNEDELTELEKKYISSNNKNKKILNEVLYKCL